MEETKGVSALRQMLGKGNVSKIFLFSVVLGDRAEYMNSRKSKAFHLVDTYLDDIDYDGKVDRPVFMLFKVNDYSRFKLFFEREKENGRVWKDDYDYPGHVMLVYSVEEALSADYQKIVEGRYSELSKEYRKRLPPAQRIDLNGAPQYEHLREKWLEQPLAWAIINKNEALYQDWMDTIGELPGNGDEYWFKTQSDRECFSFEEYQKTLKE